MPRSTATRVARRRTRCFPTMRAVPSFVDLLVGQSKCKLSATRSSGPKRQIGFKNGEFVGERPEEAREIPHRPGKFQRGFNMRSGIVRPSHPPAAGWCLAPSFVSWELAPWELGVERFLSTVENDDGQDLS